MTRPALAIEGTRGACEPTLIGTVTSRPSYLPDFESPPLAEVVIGVVMQPLHALTAAHHGLYWRAIRDQFPHTSDQPGLETAYETEQGPQAPVLGFRLGPPPLRSFFASEDQETLLQLQSDRFFNNWRKGRNGRYPHFDELAAAFHERWSGFQEFVTGEGLGALTVEQVEVTYVNVVEAGSMASDLTVTGPSPLGLRGAPPSATVELEEQQLALRYRLAGAPLARLYATAAPRGRGWLLELTVRSRPSEGDGALQADLQRARTAIDAAFVHLTSTHAHARWGIIST